MTVAYLRNEHTEAVISVEVPPAGLSDSYLRSGWHEVDPPVEDEPAPSPAFDAPAEPDDTEPASEPDDTQQE